MTVQQVQALRPGDEVKWNDPDKGLCTRIIKIQHIEVCSDGKPAVDDVVKITDVNGDYVEVFAHELE